MNDANDTIQFQTNDFSRLYHNSYPILTTQNTYVSNNKGYINGTEITQVNNADTVDSYHIADESRQVYRNYYTVDSPDGAWILIKFPAWNAVNEIVSIDGYGDNRQAHCVVYCGSRFQGIWGYQSEYNGVVVAKIRWKEADSGKFALVVLIDGGITNLSIKSTNSLEISKTTADNAAFAISSSFFSSSGVFMVRLIGTTLQISLLREEIVTILYFQDIQIQIMVMMVLQVVLSIVQGIQSHLLILEEEIIVEFSFLIQNINYFILERLLLQYIILEEEWILGQEFIEQMVLGGYTAMLLV